MPPRSYVITAVVFAVLVAVSFPVTLGFSIILWYGLFAVAAGLLAVAGAFRIANRLHAVSWIGIALVSPALIWAATHIYEFTGRYDLAIARDLAIAPHFALLVAAAAALRLAETESSPHVAFRIGYGVLAASTIMTCAELIARPLGWTFTHNGAYAIVEQTVAVAAILGTYGAFIACAAVITLRRNIERWAGIAVGLVSVFMLCDRLRQFFAANYLFSSDAMLMFWLKPVVMLIGAAAVWRIGTVLGTPPTPDHPLDGAPITAPENTAATHRAPPAVPRWIVVYFIGLVALTLVAFIPGAITIGMLLFVAPGMLLVASATLLYYSTALLPAYVIHRVFGLRLLAGVVAILSVAAAGVLPHYVYRYRLESLIASDHSDSPVASAPRSFELPVPSEDRYWTNWQRPDIRRIRGVPCADLCQQLLFKGNIDHVLIRNFKSLAKMVVTRTYQTASNGSRQAFDHVEWAPRWQRFRLEQRDTCPDTFSRIAGQFVHEVTRGRCLIEDEVDKSDADVVLSISGTPAQADRNRHLTVSSIQEGPATFTVSERQGGGGLVPTEVRTNLVAQYPTLPFYFSTIRCGGSEIPELCLTVASETISQRLADPFEMISRRYRLPIAAKPRQDWFRAVVPDTDRELVEAILKQGYGPDGHILAAPSLLIASFVNARLKSGKLDESDVELFRGLLKQRAFTTSIETDKLPPESYQALKPLLPDMFDRIAYRAEGQSEIVQSLNVMLDHFSAEDTDPWSPTLCQEHRNRDLRVCYKLEHREARKK
jgi:hypothetical protein